MEKGWKEELKGMFREMREEMKENNRRLSREMKVGRKVLFVFEIIIRING